MSKKSLMSLLLFFWVVFFPAPALAAPCLWIIWEENDFPMGTTQHWLEGPSMTYTVPRQPPFFNTVAIQSFSSEADATLALDQEADNYMSSDWRFVSHQQNGETDRYVFVRTVKGYGEDEYLTRFIAFELYRYCRISVTNLHWEEDILLSDILSDVTAAEAVVDSRCPPEPITDATLGVVGRPNQPDDLETAIIPPDDRFPARYVVRLTDKEGGSLANKTLLVRIDGTPQARLSGDFGSGSEITITTNSDGEAEFTYTHLDTAPLIAPILDEISIESADSARLIIQKTVKVSVGLKLSVVEVAEAWDDRTAVPRSLGLRIQVADAFRPGLDLAQYIANLKAETGRHLGVAVSTWWLNRPEADTVQWIKDNIKGFSSTPDDILCTNVRGWIKEVNERFIVNVIDQPFMNVGPHHLPALTLTAEGLHLFELKLVPVILPESVDDPSLIFVKSAPFAGSFFGADVYGAESVFKSVVCAFSPTDAEQFLLKAVVLDCPLLTNAVWVGEWAAGTAVPYVLLVAEVADMICNFMEGNYLNVAATLAGKYLSRLDSLHSSGEIVLTERELSLLEKGMVASSIKRFYDTYNESVNHFMPPERRFPMDFDARDGGEEEDWPEGIGLADMLDAIESMSAGLMAVPQMRGFEALAAISDAPISAESVSDERVPFVGSEVCAVVYDAKSGPGLISTSGAVKLFRIRSRLNPGATLIRYETDALGENAVLWFVVADDRMAVDRNGDGQADEFIDPMSTASFDFLSGDVNLDGRITIADVLLALRIASDMNNAEEMLRVLPWAVDLNGDGRLGMAEALYALSRIAGLR